MTTEAEIEREPINKLMCNVHLWTGTCQMFICKFVLDYILFLKTFLIIISKYFSKLFCKSVVIFSF